MTELEKLHDWINWLRNETIRAWYAVKAAEAADIARLEAKSQALYKQLEHKFAPRTNPHARRIEVSGLPEPQQYVDFSKAVPREEKVLWY